MSGSDTVPSAIGNSPRGAILSVTLEFPCVYAYKRMGAMALSGQVPIPLIPLLSSSLGPSFSRSVSWSGSPVHLLPPPSSLASLMRPLSRSDKASRLCRPLRSTRSHRTHRSLALRTVIRRQRRPGHADVGSSLTARRTVHRLETANCNANSDFVATSSGGNGDDIQFCMYRFRDDSLTLICRSAPQGMLDIRPA